MHYKNIMKTVSNFGKRIYRFLGGTVTFKVGDVVVLNSKGSLMTVMTVDPTTGALTTVWTDTVGVSHILGPIPAVCFLAAYSS